MKVLRDIDLTAYNSFGLSQRANYFISIDQLADLAEAVSFAQSLGLPIQILGGGSNVLFAKDFPGVLLHMNCKGIELLSIPKLNDGERLLKVACGENWHELVKYCLSNDLYGIENLALIPGTVGAAPIQNIGAYGVEFEQLFVELEAYDINSGEFCVMDAPACEFNYRDSIFKHSGGKHLIVVSVTLKLSEVFSPNISYHALKQTLGATSSSPDAQQVFDTVCSIRRSKLPDPQVVGNAGSFFKNPIIPLSEYQSLKQQYPELPAYDTGDEAMVKVSAAWLLEKIESKVKSKGGAAVYSKHALVLINQGTATGSDIIELAQLLSDSVKQTFGIKLQAEVTVV